MNKAVIGIVVALIIVVGGGIALYQGASPKNTDNAMMKENETMKEATTSADAMMKNETETMMASSTSAVMSDEKKGDAMMPQ